MLKEHDITYQIKQIKERMGEHDAQLNQIYDAIENLLDEKRHQKIGIKENELDLKLRNEIILNKMISK